MELPRPTEKYDQNDQAQTREKIGQALNGVYTKNANVEITSAQRLIMTDTVTNERGTLTIASGVVTWTLL